MAQPLFLILVLFLLAHLGIFSNALLSNIAGLRTHTKTVRFFECAAYSSLVGHLRYNIQALSLLAVFLIYDIDLIFFIAEILTFEGWTVVQLSFWLFYLSLFFFGLWYDSNSFGFFWSN